MARWVGEIDGVICESEGVSDRAGFWIDLRSYEHA